MKKGKIQVERTAHFWQLGEIGPATKKLWIVCHGYAQLAADFLQDFSSLDDGQNVIIAPEGLNKWYRKGFAGDVVANWMTRHEREDEIADFAAFLQKLLEQTACDLPPGAQIVLLGFSQGTATVCRWIMRHRPAFDHLVLWAGLFPEDLEYSGAADYFAAKKLWLVYGSNDPFLTEERFLANEKTIESNALEVTPHRFVGEHAVEKAALEAFLMNLN